MFSEVAITLFQFCAVEHNLRMRERELSFSLRQNVLECLNISVNELFSYLIIILTRPLIDSADEGFSAVQASRT